MLSDRDLAGLTNRLQVPVVVSDILNGKVISDEIRYGLHEILSEMQPDSALLAIALGAHKVSVRYSNLHPSLLVMKLEAARVINDYAQLWLDNARHANVNEEAARVRLSYVPEDLQSLSELLETASAFLQDINGDAAELCRIMMVQADAQSLVAEAFAEVIEYTDDLDAAGVMPANDGFTAHPVMDAAFYTNNVIQFPARV